MASQPASHFSLFIFFFRVQPITHPLPHFHRRKDQFSGCHTDVTASAFVLQQKKSNGSEKLWKEAALGKVKEELLN